MNWRPLCLVMKVEVMKIMKKIVNIKKRVMAFLDNG